MKILIISTLVTRINPYEVSDKLGQLYSEMIFKRGFVHSDPHPGNIMVKKTEKGTTEIILLDHGLYAVRRLFFFPQENRNTFFGHTTFLLHDRCII